MKQNFIAQCLQLLKHWLCNLWYGVVTLGLYINKKIPPIVTDNQLTNEILSKSNIKPNIINPIPLKTGLTVFLIYIIKSRIIIAIKKIVKTVFRIEEIFDIINSILFFSSVE